MKELLMKIDNFEYKGINDKDKSFEKGVNYLQKFLIYFLKGILFGLVLFGGYGIWRYFKYA